MTKFKTLPLSLSLMAFTASPLAGPTTSFEYDGFTYDLTTTFTSYTDNPDLLESQPWWGNASLANALMDLVRFDLGDYYGNFPVTQGISALTAYDISGSFVSVSYWLAEPLLLDESLIDCPSDCPPVEI